MASCTPDTPESRKRHQEAVRWIKRQEAIAGKRKHLHYMYGDSPDNSDCELCHSGIAEGEVEWVIK